MSMRPLIWQARAGATRVLRSAGRRDEAAEQASAAWQMAQEIGRLFTDSELQELFLAYAENRIYLSPQQEIA